MLKNQKISKILYPAFAIVSAMVALLTTAAAAGIAQAAQGNAGAYLIPVVLAAGGITVFTAALLSVLATRRISGTLSALKSALETLSAEQTGTGVRLPRDDVEGLGKEISVLAEILTGHAKELSGTAEEFSGAASPETAVPGILKSLRNALRRTIGIWKRSAEQAAEGSGRLHSSFHLLLQKNAEHLESIRELAGTAPDSAGHLQAITQNLSEAAGRVEACGKETEACCKQLSGLSDALEIAGQALAEIRSAAQDADNTASQMKYLALNASMEAARAGSGGQAFEAAAKEMRTLAETCSETAGKAVSAADRAARAAADVLRFAGKSTQPLANILKNAEGVSGNLETIAGEMKKQALFIRQFSRGTSRIAEDGQTVSVLTERAASLAQDLHAQIQDIQKQAGKFRTPAASPRKGGTIPGTGISYTEDPDSRGG